MPRPFISLLVSLCLLGQGFAVAAAERLADSSPSAAIETAAAPCHETQAGTAADPSCCGMACPDMSTCAFAHLAFTPVGAVHACHSPAGAPDAAVAAAPRSSPPKSLLRPPIALHA